jgi:signal transduction histidine kinase
VTDEERTELEARLAEVCSELDACKRQLIEASPMVLVGELFAGIVHEINTPIGSILSNNQVSARSLEMLKQLLEKAQADEAPPAPKAAKILDTLLSLAAVDKIACERVVAIVRGLKSFVGGKGLEFQQADLNEVLDNTLKLARCEFRHRIQVETDYGQIPKVECDPHQLGQVFLNLLVNAGQAIEGEGKVAVRTRLDGDSVVVSISDNGSGIPPEHHSEVFSSGFTTKPAGIGTGLGLAISRDIVVEAHGGMIDFESEPGKGTTFHIRIPVSRAARNTG